MSGQCAGTKRDGAPCTATVSGADEYCWLHDPANAEERRRAASRAGASRGPRAAENIAGGYRLRLSTIADDVIAGELDPKRAAAATQALNIALRALSVEHEHRIGGELERRIRSLEESQRWAS